MHQRGDMKTDTQRWWLRAEETCVFCVHRYASGTQVRCAVCDRAVCACCYVRGSAPERRPLCPECSREEA